METMRSRVRRMSAFWEGGREGENRKTVLKMRRDDAKKKRIGRIVNVYRNESKHRMKPKKNI